MTDSSRTYQELLAENSFLTKRIKDLEQTEQERRQTMKALRESEAKYRLIAENTADIISIMNMDQRFSYISPSVLRIRGFTVEEVLEQTLDRILTPTSLQIALNTFLEEMNLEATGTADPDRIRIMDLEQYKKDGSTVWLENSMSFLRDKDHRPVGILTVSRDITEHMRADEALRQRNEELAALNQLARAVISQLSLETAADQIAVSIRNAQLLHQTRDYAAQTRQALAERETSQQALKRREQELTHANLMLQNVLYTIPVRVFWKDLNGRYLGCNALFARDAGYERPEQIVGKNDYDLAWCDQAEIYQREDRRVMDSGQARIGFENHQMTPSGVPVVLLTSMIPLRNEAGEIVGILGTYQNIIKRKRTEEALKKNEAMLRTVFQAVPLAMVVTDAHRIVKEANDFNEVVFGYRPEEMIGRDTRYLYFSDEEHIRTGDKLRAPVPAMAEARMRRKDGSEVWMLMNRAPLNPEDPAAGLVVASLDITARKALEEQLRQSQKMEAIGQLAGGVAHDFNNMLQAILGYTEMVLFTLGPDDGNRRKLMEVFKTGQRAAVLTQQLLAFSRQQVLRLGPLDLNQTIEDLMKMLRRLIGENIELIVVPGRELWTVNADRGQIEQVLMNLCVNARDAMQEGGRLSIETGNILLDEKYCARHEWARPGRHVRLSVTDSGCGMDAGTRDKIFEPFFTTKELGRGTGLGLATVYGIVRQHNGVIDVHSEPGKGARFSINLPAIEQVKTGFFPESEDPAPGGHETILLAKDNEQIRLLAVEMLKNAGYRVFAAGQGEEALRLYHDYGREIDLLLLDVVMPEKGGRAVYDEIRALRSDIRCLFMSGYSVDAVHTNFILDEGLLLIQKPFKHKELLRTVRQALECPDE